jgi:hypothetical protein
MQNTKSQEKPEEPFQSQEADMNTFEPYVEVSRPFESQKEEHDKYVNKFEEYFNVRISKPFESQDEADEFSRWFALNPPHLFDDDE